MKYLRRLLFLAALCAAMIGCTGGDISSGDRVFVVKCAYDTHLIEPRRYDVVVFKYPQGPVEKNTPKNYIKRLLGLPGEIIAIFFGRLYHYAPAPGEAPLYDDTKAVANGDGTETPGADPLKLWQLGMLHTDDAPSQEKFDAGRFEILRKPPAVMMALRRIVYDNDFQAKDLVGRVPPRWDAARDPGWQSDDNKSFAHASERGDAVDWLRYQHHVRPRKGPLVGGEKSQPHLITDTMGYNSFQVPEEFWPAERTPHEHWAGDLMLESEVTVAEPKGELWVELSRGIDRFQARWDLTNGNCTLFRLTGEGEQVARVELDTKPTRLSAAGTYQLRFANFDARLTVWVDHDLPFGEGVAYSPPEVRDPATEKDLPEAKLLARRGPTRNDLERPAGIGSKGAPLKLNHLKLWRDTYYTSSTNGRDYAGDMSEAWSDPRLWDTLRAQRYHTFYVQPGHYLCLGDNSEASSDSRYWGLVPERLMLGRALAIYYPFHRIGTIH